jgi:hypothetical protein
MIRGPVAEAMRAVSSWMQRGKGAKGAKGASFFRVCLFPLNLTELLALGCLAPRQWAMRCAPRHGMLKR